MTGHLLKGKALKPIDKTKIHRILIRFTNWIGDAVMALPALEAVRYSFPKSEITVLVRPWVAPLLLNHPAVDRVISIEKTGRLSGDLIEVLKVAAGIRRQGFDLALLFQNAFEAALLAYLGGIGLRIGYNTDRRGLLLTHAVLRERNDLKRHQVEDYLSLLRAMGWEAPSCDPRLHISPADEEAARVRLSLRGVGEGTFLVGFGPGAAYGPAKRWPADRFAAIGDLAIEKWNARILLFGSEGDREVSSQVRSSMKHKAWDLCGKVTLGEATAMIGQCRCFVTNDSGLMHVAAALEVPTVAVFGSTDPAATGPRGKHTRVVMKKTDCAPCLKPVCSTHYRCLSAVDVKDVWEAMVNLREGLR